MSGLGPSETPGWLSNKKDVEAPPSKDWDSTEITTSKDSSIDDDSAKNRGGVDDESSSERPSMLKRVCLFGLSALFLAFFIYAVFEQRNDNDKYEWSIFYGISGTIPALFLTHWIICFPDKIISLISLGMFAWSGTYIVLFALDLKDTPAGGEKVGTGDEDDLTLREEIITELIGVSIACFSALYHPLVMCCCINKKKKE